MVELFVVLSRGINNWLQSFWYLFIHQAVDTRTLPRGPRQCEKVAVLGSGHVFIILLIYDIDIDDLKVSQGFFIVEQHANEVAANIW